MKKNVSRETANAFLNSIFVSISQYFNKILVWIGFPTSPLSDLKKLLRLDQRIKNYGQNKCGINKKTSCMLFAKNGKKEIALSNRKNLWQQLEKKFPHFSVPRNATV